MNHIKTRHLLIGMDQYNQLKQREIRNNKARRWLIVKTPQNRSHQSLCANEVTLGKIICNAFCIPQRIRSTEEMKALCKNSLVRIYGVPTTTHRLTRCNIL